ncbi:hypothetical protein Vretifemale_20797, partial [Volvox reticuliferus]
MGKDRLDELLDLNNYATWKLRFELLCGELGYGHALLAAPISEADVNMSNKVKSVMAKNVKNHHLQTIVRAANAKAAWDALAATFASTCNTRKIALRQELSDFKMANGEHMPVYVSRARQLQSDLLDVGHVVTDAELTTIIIKGLPRTYHVITTALETREGELDFQQVVSRLMAYDSAEREASRKETTAFSARRGGGNAGSSGRGQGARTGGRPNVTCHYCGTPGHFMRDCRKRLADQGSKGRGGDGKQRGGSASAMPSKLAFALGGESRLKDWHIDSGSEWHITYDASELKNVRAVKTEELFNVIGYDGSRHQPTHVGSCTLKSNVIEGLEIDLLNVYVVPKATVKLISAGILDDRGAKVVLGDGKALVQHQGRTILQGEKVGNLYAIRYNAAG